ncbi:MAG: hypothetical protein ACRCZD_15260, partial [Phycicoccus sp.]
AYLCVRKMLGPGGAVCSHCDNGKLNNADDATPAPGCRRPRVTAASGTVAIRWSRRVTRARTSVRVG